MDSVQWGAVTSNDIRYPLTVVPTVGRRTPLSTQARDTAKVPLSDTAIRNAKPQDKAFKIADEKGMYLLVNKAGKYFRWDYRYLGKRLTMAIGVYPDTSLKEAREKLATARSMLASGVDPMAHKAETKRLAILDAANSFRAVALEWHASKVKAKAWVPGTAEKKLLRLENDVFPVVGSRPIKDITPPEALAMLRKIESRGAAYTAIRIREMCGQVFRYGIATGRCESNPMRDLVDTITAPAVTHHPALTSRQTFGPFLRDLAEFDGASHITMPATRIAVLSMLRSKEFRLGRWPEVDWDNREWRVPGERMKMGKQGPAHIVPLSDQLFAALRELHELTKSTPTMFPAVTGADKFISENTIGNLLIRMGYKGRQTLHGFRASARSILAERGWHPDALERQLDQAEENKVKAAYARAEFLEERRRIMADWGNLVQAMEEEQVVVPLPRRAA